MFLWILSENLFRYWQNATFTFFLDGKSSKAPYVSFFLSFKKRIPFSGQKLNSAGERGGLQIFFLMESSNFCYLGAHAKFRNPMTTPPV
jgi:hypothetical protein